MSNLHVDVVARTIEMNKSFAEKAYVFGTDEYNQLQAVRRDYPQFRVVTVKQKGAKPEFKSLDYSYIEKYVSSHDDEDGTLMAEYRQLRGQDENGNEVARAAHYTVIKDWFLNSFPEFEAFHNERDRLLDKIREQKQARLATRKKAA